MQLRHCSGILLARTRGGEKPPRSAALAADEITMEFGLRD